MKEGLSTQQKEADKDLNILALFTLLPLMGFLAFQEPIINFTRSPDHSLWIRLIVLALCQFSVAGLGTSAVLIRRKESIQKYGLVNKKFFPTILQTVLIALPLLIFLIASGQMHSYLPFQSILLTKEVLSSPFPTNFLGYLLISLIWGFWEGFNYVVIVQKINLRYPQYVKGVWNLGAFVCALICLLIHGMIGFDSLSLLQEGTVFILIYGMLLVQRRTGNAWGCILIFVLLWNAF